MVFFGTRLPLKEAVDSKGLHAPQRLRCLLASTTGIIVGVVSGLATGSKTATNQADVYFAVKLPGVDERRGQCSKAKWP